MNAKILIADDESDIVSMLGNFFESKGFRVLPAFNGAEALLHRANRLHLV